MPVTITLPPSGEAGPGIRLVLSTDLIGPIPIGTLWNVVFSTDNEGVQRVGSSLFDAVQSHTGAFFPYLGEDLNATVGAQQSVADGGSIFVVVQLVEPGNVVIDSGTIAAKWNPSSALPIEIASRSGGSTTGGGLTDAQAQQLTETHASTFTDQLIDDLTLIPLTSGPSAGPVNSFLTDTTFGVIVRLATVPDDLVATTPDLDYWLTTLAVVRVFRGSDLWLRFPIHTSNRMIPFVTQNLVAAVAALTATQWLLNMSLQVTFLPGVTGEVFLMRFP